MSAVDTHLLSMAKLCFSVLNKWHLDKLTTHILALALAVDDFDSDTHDIREDLRLDAKNITKYYHELGCAIAGPTEAEMAAIGIKKAEGPGHRIAKLRLPLVFPRMRVPTSGRKKRIEKKARLH